MEFGVGSILSGAFTMMKQRIAPLIGICVLFFVILTASSLLFTLVLGLGSLAVIGNENPFAMGAGFILTIVLYYVFYLLVVLAQQGALVSMASPVQEPNFGEAFFAGVKSALPLLGVGILLGIAYIVGAGILGAILGLVAQGSAILSVITLLIFVPLMIYLSARLSLIVPFASVTGIMNPIKLIAHSWRETSGRVLPIFLAWLLFWVGFAVLIGLAIVPVYSLFTSGAAQAAEAAAAFGTIAYIFVAFLVIMLVATIGQCAIMATTHGQLVGSAEQDLGETFA